MNIALILAAGVDPGFRMDIPKQFVVVENRPLIVYTLQVFQEHPEIDRIVVSCLSGWQEMVRAYAKQFDITKLTDIVEGGIDAQESSWKGIERLREQCRMDDVVIVHDAIRPLVTDDLISDSIRVCRKEGMGVAAVRSMDTIMLTQDGKTGRESISRYDFRRIQTPQAYRLDYLIEMHQRASEKKMQHSVDNNSMIAKLGETIYFSKGSDFNIKINTVEDVEMFKALYHMKQKIVRKKEELE
ncbi:MAG: 2-C-methyl-D-erythritol 4-phosphate cytidylyltransferase [Roseburia sp.]|nr:2-C-methyl-D-erythritol 4-phosphate cytidylyltransferase [Roseburia sp.]